MESKITELREHMAEKEEEFQAVISVAKLLLLVLPDEDMKRSVTKKLDKAYKHRVKSNKRLLEALDAINACAGESDE